MHTKNIFSAGKKIQETSKVLILVHGRGGSAQDILSLANYLEVKDFSLLAPQAANNTWYPYSFLVPPTQNEPSLSSALSLLKTILNDVLEQGIHKENVYFLGFSQGACLALEFVAQNAARYGGVVAFSGGLIGDKVNKENYQGNFNETPFFIGSSNPDAHVPVERVHETTQILKEMHANVTEKIYDNMGHIISQDEIALANKLVFARAENKV